MVVCESPNGEPIATASWPVLTAVESASESAFSLRLDCTLTTARSDERSTPVTRPVSVSSSANCTWTEEASPTTWALVTIVPSVSTMKPVPEPSSVLIETTDSRAAA